MDQEVEQILRVNSTVANRLYFAIAPHEENVLISPLGVHHLLALISQDTGYHKKDKFHHLIQVDCIDVIIRRYKDALAYLNSIYNGHFQTCNKAYLRDTFQLHEIFKTILSDSFCCELESIDFSKTKLAAEAINLWVESNTNKKTQNLLNSSILNSEERLALLNSTNFKSKWANQFRIEDTTPEVFHVNDNDTIKVQMMKATREVNYKVDEYLDVKIVELPYANSDLSLCFILPNKGASIKDLENKLRWTNANSLVYDMSKQEVAVSIPKFKFEESREVKNVLRELGLEDEFSENASLFGMVDSEEFLCFKNIQENVFIEVNEEGSEAASGIIFTLVPTAEDKEQYLPENGLIIYEMNIKSNISNRFAKNMVVSKVKNTDKVAKEAIFSVVLPETAFITEFVMEIEGKSYKSLIKRKEEAKTIYNEAVATGKSAGIVEASTRNSNEFSVSVNLEPESVAVFSLTYEEMLQRIDDQYELVLNIRPGQIVEKLDVEVNINESRPLKFVKTPPLRSGNEVTKLEKYLQPSTDIKMFNSKSAVIKFNPDSQQQKRISRYLGTKVADGFAGQFVVQYDVQRDPQGGEILLQDGYFVHFFAPNDLDPLPKHVVFVLDTSSSMSGRKISQLKDAMMSILNEIRTNDIISIIEFNSNVIVWDINSETSVSFTFDDREIFEDPFRKLCEYSMPNPTYASKETISKAKNVVQRICTEGCTFMIGGLETALYLVKLEQDKIANKSQKYQPIMVFLTDGEPNVGISQTEEIVKTVTRLNLKYNKVPIFSLSFGEGADKEFLRQLSLKNMGFSRHIYEASDAALQLRAFYKQISSPLLSDVTFKYEADVREVTRSRFPIFFRGDELIVSGRYEGSLVPVAINCCGTCGPIIIRSTIQHPVTSLERLWAYLTVRQLLEEKNSVEDNTEIIKKATEIALKYSFVTDVTSLVVVKPNETNAVVSGEDEKEELLEDCCMMTLCCAAMPADADSYPVCDFQDLLAFPEVQCSAQSMRITSKVRRTAARSVLWKKKKCCLRLKDAAEMEVNEEEGKEEEPPKEEIPQTEFLADHPFLVALLLKKGDERIVLFMGRVTKPCY